MITRDSTIGDLLKNPIGHDVLSRLTLFGGVDERFIDNPLSRSVKLKALPKLFPKMFDDALLDSLLELFNQAQGEAAPAPSSEEAWWKEAVVYQIYPRSFKDGNGDGVGDLPGIIEKLDYIAALGVTAVWLSPVYDSPNDDNGYDVRDYRKIMAEFGTKEDMDRLIDGLHKRGIRLVMDLVLNHTSDEHAWFQSSKAEPNGRYGDYYIWRKSGAPDTPPNNWISLFSGPAWNYYPARDEWALHLFSKKQMDLNWECEALREDVYDLIHYWRGKGVDGFRLDVINFISKTSLADGNRTLAGLLGICGIEHYFYGRDLHTRLRELRARGFEDAFTVGETPGTGFEMNKLLTAPERKELSTVFCFDHLDCVGKSRFHDYRYDLNHLKRCFLQYEGAYADVSWPTIFTENHDNPRMVSKIDPDPAYRETIAKLLAVLMLTARGTVFLYQGQELGTANVAFDGIGEIRDVESLNLYNEKIAAGMPQEDAWRMILSGTRDHARTPMQWDATINAGFTAAAEPWIRAGNYTAVNAAREEADEGSVLHFYRAMIALRRAHRALVYGTFIPVHEKRRDYFAYERADGGERFFIEANLSEHALARPAYGGKRTRLYANYDGEEAQLRPYEAAVYRID